MGLSWMDIVRGWDLVVTCTVVRNGYKVTDGQLVADSDRTR